MKCLAVILLAVVVSVSASLSAIAGNPRTKTHEDYIRGLWKFLQDSSYRSWPQAAEFTGIGVGPRIGQKTYASQKGNWDEGSIAISEHWDGDALFAISFFARQKPGYSEKNRDWYWVSFLADGTVISASPDKETHRKPGFVTWEDDGRLWVFGLPSVDAADFVKSGDLARSVTRIAAGPEGMTVRSSDTETIDAYLAVKTGFETFIVDGRLWVFRDGSEGLSEFKQTGEPAMSVTRVGAGPNGMTIRSVDGETIDAYLN
ncbi:hypothetical protein GC176_09260 [bacterium]|nr:hypothetical protein [bacterium]